MLSLCMQINKFMHPTTQESGLRSGYAQAQPAATTAAGRASSAPGHGSGARLPRHGRLMRQAAGGGLLAQPRCGCMPQKHAQVVCQHVGNRQHVSEQRFAVLAAFMLSSCRATCGVCERLTLFDGPEEVSTRLLRARIGLGILRKHARLGRCAATAVSRFATHSTAGPTQRECEHASHWLRHRRAGQ